MVILNILDSMIKIFFSISCIKNCFMFKYYSSNDNKRFDWKNRKRSRIRWKKWNQIQKIAKETFNLSNGLPIMTNQSQRASTRMSNRRHIPWNLYSPIIFTLNDLFRSNWIWKNGSETQIERGNQTGRGEKKIYFRCSLKAFIH